MRGCCLCFRRPVDKDSCSRNAIVPCRNEPEVRVLFARGQAIGSYGRIAKHDSPSNLAKGATAIAYQIGPELDEKVERVGAWLQGEGIGFAAADFRDNHLIEINIANPGGLGTIERLTGVDLSANARRAARDARSLQLIIALAAVNAKNGSRGEGRRT